MTTSKVSCLSHNTKVEYPLCNLIMPCDYYQYISYEKILANHFHLRLMTMYKGLYITDPLNGVLKQNPMKTCLSKLFFCEVFKRYLVYFH